MTAATDEAVARLEARVRELEDRLEIFQLMARYGPCADSGSGDIVETLFTEDGVYDSGIQSFDGAAAIGEMIESLPLHRALMDGGCAHMITMPVVKVDGDRAIAFCHGQLLRHQGDSFEVWRTSATRWELERSPQGWKIARRVNRLLDGDVSAQKLFRDALLEPGS
jgi:hypothetical protein